LLYDRHTSVGMIIGPLVIIGAGVGATFQPTLIALQSHVPKSRRAVIISNRNFFRCGGGAAGLAISAAVLQAVLRTSLPEEYKYLASNAYAVPKVQGPGFEGVLNAYMAASRAVFILQVPIMGVCLLGSVFLRDHGLGHPGENNGNDISKGDDGPALEAGGNLSSREKETGAAERPVLVAQVCLDSPVRK
jgi:hypothetical protein